MNISQISYQVGLSPKQFAKFFKEEFGYLPSEYKKKKKMNFSIAWSIFIKIFFVIGSFL